MDTFFCFTKPSKGKYTDLIRSLLRNKPARLALCNPNEDPSQPLDGSSFALLESLCQDAQDIFNEENCALEVNIAPTDTLVLVGDVHGQFRDLQYHILSVQQKRIEQGAKKDAIYLFLGDYVDRGSCGVEVITLLLALKVEYPQNIYMIRGNHEEAQVCRMYGFLHECKMKLAVECWNFYNNVFMRLPLATVVTINGVVNGKTEKVGSFFCCHGGLTEALHDIPTLQFINRVEYGQGILPDEDNQRVDGLLWSDPGDHDGFRPNLRGCGYTFGKDTTANFCANNNVDFVCRAHQMIKSGYQWEHEGRLLTIFSAPNYCGVNDNAGAIAIIDGAKQNGELQSTLQSEEIDHKDSEKLVSQLTADSDSFYPTHVSTNVSRIAIEFVVYMSAPTEPCSLFGPSEATEGDTGTIPAPVASNNFFQ